MEPENTLQAILDALTRIDKLLTPRDPIDTLHMISSSNAYILDYRERKHIYFWLPSTALTLSFGDYGSGLVQAQVWTNIGFPAAVPVLATGQVANTPIFVKCTDEVIP